MNEEKLVEFNKELKELLAKYDCALTVEQKIVVVKTPVAEEVK